ncbi:MAG: hypothetical protein WA996_12750 [Candidatus Promineifilaceae bacterium]
MNEEPLTAEPGCVSWLLGSDEPWTRYRTLVDLLDKPEWDVEVESARNDMLDHPSVKDLVDSAASWPGGRSISRHNDASHPLYALSTLADFGVTARDPGMAAAVDAVLAHQSYDGALQSLLNIPVRYGGSGEDAWSWVLCDTPTLLYSMLAMGKGEEPRVCQAVDHLVTLVETNGWRCLAAPGLGKFRGPGRKDDPCPMAIVYSLKALAQVPEQRDSAIVKSGIEHLLWHWEHQSERKIYLFGIGTDYRKLKYPYVWYNILHVVDVLSQFASVHQDARFREMVSAIVEQADEDGLYRASSMYKAWKGWSFADKKAPSPWLTFLVARLMKRTEVIIHL